ncbi:hypothetical protein Pst134EB_030921 [Puccinia striiformis f. sp. tritici]|nr:hypothetical protein Pst134EB_030921 [Puccinia striiformis f. sp. tritici]
MSGSLKACLIRGSTDHPATRPPGHPEFSFRPSPAVFLPNLDHLTRTANSIVEDPYNPLYTHFFKSYNNAQNSPQHLHTSLHIPNLSHHPNHHTTDSSLHKFNTTFSPDPEHVPIPNTFVKSFSPYSWIGLALLLNRSGQTKVEDNRSSSSISQVFSMVWQIKCR